MSKKKNKSGFSLVEIMVSLLLFLVLLIGGALVLFSTGSDIQVYGNKRVALELARTELEGLLTLDYATLRMRAIAGNPDTGSRTESWNDTDLGIDWTNRLVSAGGILNNEYLELDVSVSFLQGTDETILLKAKKTITP